MERDLSTGLSTNNQILGNLSQSLQQYLPSTWNLSISGEACYNSTSQDLYASNWEGVECLNDTVFSISLSFNDLSLLALDIDLQPLSGLSGLNQLDLSQTGIGGSIPASFSQLIQLTYLDLSANSLQGSIPPELAGLTQLNYFDVSSNALSGNLPPQLSNWVNIQTFRLSSNQIVGSIPPEYSSFGTSIQAFRCDLNQLSGDISDSLSDWTSITWFSVAGNQNLEGTLPPVLSSWTQVEIFDVSSTFLEGSLPSSYGLWSGILRFYVYSTQISGVLPASYSVWSNIQRFYVHDTLLTGTIPSVYDKWLSIQRFYIYSSNISGTIPESFGNWTKLTVFQVQNTFLSGTLSSSFSKWTQLFAFYIQNTNIEGQLPPAYSSWINLKYFIFNLTPISGTLPNSYSSLQNLILFYGYSSEISGSIPESYGQMTAITDFDFHHTKLYGQLPESLSRWTQLVNIFIYETNIEGTLQNSFSSWTNLQNFLAHSTNLSGSLPPGYSAWTNLQSFRIDNTSINGSLPESYSEFSNLGMFVVSFTGLEGSIPESYGIWGDSVQSFYVGNTSLGGSLPSSLENFTNINVFDASFANFSGSLPFYCSWTYATKLVLSGNRFSGDGVPSCWKKMTNLILLDLSFNQFQVFDLSDLPPNLQKLDISSNQIEGTSLEVALALLPSTINEFNVSNNLFSGSLNFNSIGPNLVQFDLSFNKFTHQTLRKEDFRLPLNRNRDTLIVWVNGNSFWCPFPSSQDIQNENGVANGSVVLIKDKCETEYIVLYPYSIALGCVAIIASILYLKTASANSNQRSSSNVVLKNFRIVFFVLTLLGGIYHHINIALVYGDMVQTLNLATPNNCEVANNKPVWYESISGAFSNGDDVSSSFPEFSCTTDLMDSSCTHASFAHSFNTFEEYFQLILLGWPSLKVSDVEDSVQNIEQLFSNICKKFYSVNGVNECQMNNQTYSCDRVIDVTLVSRKSFLSLVQISYSVIIVKEAFKVLVIGWMLVVKKSPTWLRLIVQSCFLSPLLFLRLNNFMDDIVLYQARPLETLFSLIFDGVLEGINELIVVYNFATEINETGVDALAILSMALNMAALLRTFSFFLSSFYSTYCRRNKERVLVFSDNANVREETKGEVEIPNTLTTTADRFNTKKNEK